jgi:hypothetical protein
LRLAEIRWGTAALLLGVFLAANPAAARVNGIIGNSGKQATTCSDHHTGGVAPEVRFEGPMIVGARQLATFRFVVRSEAPADQISAGFNVAASDGTLGAGPGSKLDTGELTHTTPRNNDAEGEAAWQFTWRAPAHLGPQTLFGAGNSVDGFLDEAGDNSSKTTIQIDVRCLGDCGNDGAVDVDELIRGVGAALGSTSADACPALDGDGNGTVTIAELVTAVRNALDGCQ